MDILEMCMWSFDSIKLILTEKQPFNICHFGQLFHYAWGMQFV